MSLPGPLCNWKIVNGITYQKDQYGIWRKHELFSRSFRIAIAQGEATASVSMYYAEFRCTHDFVDIVLETVGKIGLLCTICDQASVYPEWVYQGRGIPVPQSRGELFGRALTRAMGMARTIIVPNSSSNSEGNSGR